MAVTAADVKKLRDFIESDAKLKKSFKRVFRRKLRKISVYWIKKDE